MGRCQLLRAASPHRRRFHFSLPRPPRRHRLPDLDRRVETRAAPHLRPMVTTHSLVIAIVLIQLLLLLVVVDLQLLR